MERITKPLSQMGAEIITKNGKLPLHIKGKVLNNAKIEIDIPFSWYYLFF